MLQERCARAIFCVQAVKVKLYSDRNKKKKKLNHALVTHQDLDIPSFKPLEVISRHFRLQIRILHPTILPWVKF